MGLFQDSSGKLAAALQASLRRDAGANSLVSAEVKEALQKSCLARLRVVPSYHNAPLEPPFLTLGILSVKRFPVFPNTYSLGLFLDLFTHSDETDASEERDLENGGVTHGHLVAALECYLQHLRPLICEAAEMDGLAGIKSHDLIPRPMLAAQVQGRRAVSRMELEWVGVV